MNRKNCRAKEKREGIFENDVQEGEDRAGLPPAIIKIQPTADIIKGLHICVTSSFKISR